MLTNEERQVVIYSKVSKPTMPEKVTPDTPLEELNLNWRESDLPEKIRTKHVHRLHPYLGKFIPQLVEIFLRKYFLPSQTVLDPFCGSGTTLVQANELGINSIGYDISEFNVMLARAKTARYDLSRLNFEVFDIFKRLKNVMQEGRCQLDFWEGKITNISIMSDTDSQYLKDWYAPKALLELLTYTSLIEKEAYKYKDLLKIILSRSARSARLTPHYDLDFPKKPQTQPYWCYKHSRECSPTQEALKFIERYSIDTFRRVREFASIRTNAVVTVEHGDSREIEIAKIDGVITSPPYVGLIDYHKQHEYAYNLLGLQDNQEKEIGPASNGTSQKAKEEYQHNIALVFRRITDLIPKGGRIIVVANDNSNLYGKIAELVGIEVEHIVHRHVNRRTGRRSNQFFESIFIWVKH